MPSVLITGASDGIGRALVDRYQDDGWDVIAHGRRPPDEIDPPLPASVIYLRLDLAADLDDGIVELLDAVPDALDVAILNAGVGLVAAPADTAATDIAQMIAVNTTAPLRLAQALHRRLAAADGTLVFIGSTASRGRHGDFAVYAATKAALAGAARSLRLEWADRVDVQIIHPGPTATGMHDKAGLAHTPIRRFFTEPDTVAEAIKASVADGRSTRRFGLGFTLRHAFGKREP